jgi:predicted O-methyltransferase YrrM
VNTAPSKNRYWQWLPSYVKQLACSQNRQYQDYILAKLAIPAASVMKAFRQLGAASLPKTRETFRRLGVYPLLDHYYDPLFQPTQLRHSLRDDRDLPGIDLNTDGQLDLIAQLNDLPYTQELLEANWHGAKTSAHDFRLHNGAFESGDAEFLYQFVRLLKPKRVIEIGSGSSTKIVRAACTANARETEIRCQHTCIEPYEMPWLETMGIDILRQKAETCDLKLFEELQAGDFLFIDSSHIIRPQGDVLFEYLSLLPRLNPGVYVHIHDIFTPKDYLDAWVEQCMFFWNEQYLLEALLSHSSRYKVIAALNYLKHKHYNALKSVCPYLSQDREPGSFYIQVHPDITSTPLPL